MSRRVVSGPSTTHVQGESGLTRLHESPPVITGHHRQATSRPIASDRLDYSWRRTSVLSDKPRHCVSCPVVSTDRFCLYVSSLFFTDYSIPGRIASIRLLRSCLFPSNRFRLCTSIQFYSTTRARPFVSTSVLIRLPGSVRFPSFPFRRYEGVCCV
jgi:hypothetical protein